MHDTDPGGLWARFDRWRRTTPVPLPHIPARWTAGLALLLVPALAVGMARQGPAPAEPVAVAEIPATFGGPELPLSVTPRVEKWLRRFATDRRDEFQSMLEREGIYAGMIRAKLRDRGMPEELLYLAMMESGLSPWAVSSASAVGMWQFMGPTAREYGLRVDEYVDERRDPVRATDAALDYLAVLYERYDSWYLAAAAYNAGPGRVSRVLRRHAGGRAGDEALYWEVIEHLPRETREYVPRLVAAALLAGSADELGFSVQRAEPYEFDRVWVPGGTALRSVARSLGVKTSLLRGLNPHLIRGVTPPGESYAIRVPVGDAPMVVASMGRHSTRRWADD